MSSVGQHRDAPWCWAEAPQHAVGHSLQGTSCATLDRHSHQGSLPDT